MVKDVEEEETFDVGLDAMNANPGNGDTSAGSQLCTDQQRLKDADRIVLGCMAMGEGWLVCHSTGDPQICQYTAVECCGPEFDGDPEDTDPVVPDYF